MQEMLKCWVCGSEYTGEWVCAACGNPACPHCRTGGACDLCWLEIDEEMREDGVEDEV